MTISVIIPAYNAEDTLEACVRSVLAQDYRDLEIFLVDDGSTDRTGELCDALALEDARIRVFHVENRGPSAARNRGIDAAKGEYIAFADADDYLEPTCISYLLSLVGASDDCRICQANHWIRRGDREETNAPAGNEVMVFTRGEAAEAVLFHDRVDVSAWGKLFHRSVFEHIRFPEDRIFEDTWIFGEMLKQTGTYVYGSQPQYHYVRRSGSLSAPAYSSRSLSFIEAAEKLAADVLEIVPDCQVGAFRRINHARLSVLRGMEHCEGEDREVRGRLRQQVLQDAPKYLDDPRTPKRDKVAVRLLRIGFPAFYVGWALYERIRG